MPRKPKPVKVGELTARPHRPPSDADPRWSWRCRRFDPTERKQISVWSGRGTRRQVEDALIKARDEAPKPTIQRMLPSQIKTVEQLLDTWYSTTVHGCRKESTQVSYRCHAKLAKRYMGELQLVHVTTADLERARRSMSEEYAPWSIRSAFTAARAAWRWAVEIGAVRTVVPTFPQLDRRRVSDGYTPSLEDVWAVIDSYDPKRACATRAVLTIMVATGCRPGEAVNVTHRDVEIHGDSVAIVFGRHEGAEKTGSRRVPIFGEAADLVRGLALAEGRASDVAAARADTRIVLRANGVPISHNYAKNLARSLKTRPWDRIGVRAFTPQGVRRAAVDRFARSGVPAADAAAVLGHSIETMLTFYRQVSERDKAEAMLRAGMGSRARPNVQSIDAERERRSRESRNTLQEQSQNPGTCANQESNNSPGLVCAPAGPPTYSSGRPRSGPCP